MESTDACYEKTFTATVTSVTPTTVVLDQTIFYPLGGGQPPDLGTLEGDHGPIEVSDVRGRDDVQHHVPGDHGFDVGDHIHGEIDWDRRYSHMRMHTAQHLISGLAYEITNGARTVGNQIGTDKSRIDLNPVKFDEETLEELLVASQTMVDEGHPVTASQMTRSQVNSLMPSDRTNMVLIPKSVSELRVISIGDEIDICPCAGTHVRSLSEIGTIEWIGTPKSKGKGTQRITYRLL